MSDQYDIDSSCSTCGESANFSIKLVKGHKKRHRVANCPHCGLEEVLTDCKCATKEKEGQP